MGRSKCGSTYFLYASKHVWLATFVPIGANTKINLARVLVCFESFRYACCESQNEVLGW